jgi:PAS domain S-box-containing protein
MKMRNGLPGKILVVDDDAAGREALHRVLTRAGHTVLHAADIASAWPQIGTVDLAIIDVNLPDGNGLDFTRSLRADLRYAALAILQISALAVGPTDHADGLDSGADAYLVHPIPSIVLNSTVGALLRLRRAEKSLSERDRDLRSALDAGGVTVARIDFQTQAIDATEGLMALFGTERASAVPLAYMDTYVHSDDRAAVHEALRNLKLGRDEETEFRVLTPRRGLRWILSRASPLRDNDGVVGGVTTTLVDITSRRTLQGQLAAIEKVLERTNAALEFEELAKRALPEIRDAWNVDIVALCLQSDDGRMELSASHGDEVELPAPIPLNLTTGLLSRVMQTGEAKAEHSAQLSAQDLSFFRTEAVSAAAAPVLTADGQLVGVIAVAACTHREFNAESLQLLAVLGARLGGPLRRVQASAEQRALVVALQEQLLPQRTVNPSSVQLAVRYIAGSSHLDIGGDWYDCIELASGEAILLVGDVTGKGAKAAVVMGRIRSFTQALAGRASGPADLLSGLNQLLYRDDLADMATLCCVWLSADRNLARLTLAGHPPPLLIVPGVESVPATVTFLDAVPCLPLGAGSATRYEEAKVVLPSDWTLLLYTDGLVEKRRQNLDVGLGHLSRHASEASTRSLGELADAVVRGCSDSIGQHDDIALLVARRHTAALLQLRIPNQRGAIAGLRRELRRWAERFAPNIDTEALLVCACEAASNSIQHACGLGNETVEVTAEIDQDDAIVTVRDSGRWRNRTSDGHGLRLIGTMTKTHTISSDDDGTTVTMVFDSKKVEV